MYQAEPHGRKKARAMLNRAGVKVGGHLKHEKSKIGKDIAEEAVSEHEGHLHKGEPKTKLKLKSGGMADGGAGSKRLDKGSRKGTTVNVIVAPHPSAPPMMPPPGAMPPRPMPMPSPQMAGPPPGMPMGGAPMAPAGMPGMKTGGAARRAAGGKLLGMTAGSASGEGRLQKEVLQRKARGAGK